MLVGFVAQSFTLQPPTPHPPKKSHNQVVVIDPEARDYTTLEEAEIDDILTAIAQED